MKGEFIKIYKKGGWKKGRGETVSGLGSTLGYTDVIRNSLPQLLRELCVTTVLDAPSGDFNWFGKMDIGDTKYIGMDIVSELVKQNNAKYASDNRAFLGGDATKDPLPYADLMLCRDLLLHLPLKSGLALLRNFLKSEIPFILVSSYPVSENKDVVGVSPGRPLNLRLEPFCLPEPKRALPDWKEGFDERYLCLWSRDEVRQALGMIEIGMGRRKSLLKAIPKQAKIAEIGVWMGEFSRRILKFTSPKELHLIDPWRFDPAMPSRLYGGKHAQSQADMDAIQNSVKEKFRNNPEVTLHRMFSLEAAATFSDEYFHCVYIDGDHSYQSVLDDLRAWSPKIRPGGLLTGDGYNWKDEQNGFSVMRAVTQFAEESGNPLFSMRNGQFIFRT